MVGLCAARPSLPISNLLIGAFSTVSYLDIKINTKINPERRSQPDRRNLEKVFRNFRKGPRVRLGMNLASTELYVRLATNIRKFEFELFEARRGDVDANYNFMVATLSLNP